MIEGAVLHDQNHDGVDRAAMACPDEEEEEDGEEKKVVEGSSLEHFHGYRVNESIRGGSKVVGMSLENG